MTLAACHYLQPHQLLIDCAMVASYVRIMELRDHAIMGKNPPLFSVWTISPDLSSPWEGSKLYAALAFP